MLLVEQLVNVERREQRCCGRHGVVGARAVQEKTAINNTQLCKGRTRDDSVATGKGRKGGGVALERVVGGIIGKIELLYVLRNSRERCKANIKCYSKIALGVR